MNAEQIEHADGRVELNAGVQLTDESLVNKDLAPTHLSERTWSTYTYAALWVSMAHCIPTYMLASGLIGSGMNWWQALITILVGNVTFAFTNAANGTMSYTINGVTSSRAITRQVY